MQHRNILLASPHENTIELIIAVLSHQQFYIPIPSVQEGLIKHRLNKKKTTLTYFPPNICNCEN